MADPVPWRTTFLINYGKFGISETYYFNQPSYLAFVTQIQRYMDLRMKMLPVDATMAGIRISQDGKSRAGISLETGQHVLVGGATLRVPSAGSYVPNTNLGWDQSRAALLLNLYIADARVGIRYVAPIPDGVSGSDKDGPRFDKEPIWLVAYQDWVNAIVADGWGVMLEGGALYQAGLAGLQPEREIARWSISAEPSNNLVAELRFADSLNLETEPWVVVRGVRSDCKALSALNGKWRVAKVTAGVSGGANQMIELEGTSGFDLAELKKPGKIRVWYRRFVDISALSFKRIGIHDRGGPFFVTVGRDPARPNR